MILHIKPALPSSQRLEPAGPAISNSHATCDAKRPQFRIVLLLYNILNKLVTVLSQASDIAAESQRTSEAGLVALTDYAAKPSEKQPQKSH